MNTQDIIFSGTAGMEGRLIISVPILAVQPGSLGETAQDIISMPLVRNSLT